MALTIFDGTWKAIVGRKTCMVEVGISLHTEAPLDDLPSSEPSNHHLSIA